MKHYRAITLVVDNSLEAFKKKPTLGGVQAREQEYCPHCRQFLFNTMTGWILNTCHFKGECQNCRFIASAHKKYPDIEQYEVHFVRDQFITEVMYQLNVLYKEGAVHSENSFNVVCGKPLPRLKVT